MDWGSQASLSFALSWSLLRLVSNELVMPSSRHILCHCGGGWVAKSCPTLATPWTVARQAPLSMGFSRQEYQSGLPCPSPGDLPHPGTEPRSPALQAVSLPTELWTTNYSWALVVCWLFFWYSFLPNSSWNYYVTESVVNSSCQPCQVVMVVDNKTIYWASRRLSFSRAWIWGCHFTNLNLNGSFFFFFFEVRETIKPLCFIPVKYDLIRKSPCPPTWLSGTNNSH